MTYFAILPQRFYVYDLTGTSSGDYRREVSAGEAIEYKAVSGYVGGLVLVILLEKNIGRIDAA